MTSCPVRSAACWKGNDVSNEIICLGINEYEELVRENSKLRSACERLEDMLDRYEKICEDYKQFALAEFDITDKLVQLHEYGEIEDE